MGEGGEVEGGGKGLELTKASILPTTPNHSQHAGNDSHRWMDIPGGRGPSLGAREDEMGEEELRGGWGKGGGGRARQPIPTPRLPDPAARWDLEGLTIWWRRTTCRRLGGGRGVGDK